MGKRLCGSIHGGHSDWSDYHDESVSQWFDACSSGGMNNYPYGGNPSTGTTDGYDSPSCVGGDRCLTGCWYGGGLTLMGGSLEGCASTESGYQGVYDMSGNVDEWEDSCSYS